MTGSTRPPLTTRVALTPHREVVRLDLTSALVRARDGEPIEVTRRRHLWATVDLRDADLVLRLAPWHLVGELPNLYAETIYETNGHRLYLSMHHLIIGPPPKPGLRVGHRNGNGLDNRRGNLHWATQSQLLAKRKPSGPGSSRYKGVCWDREQGKWLAAFRRRKVGRFLDEEEAARAFDAAAFAYWSERGEECYLNFPDEHRHP